MLVYQRVGKQLLGDDLQRGNGEEPMIHATFSEFIWVPDVAIASDPPSHPALESFWGGGEFLPLQLQSFN